MNLHTDSHLEIQSWMKGSRTAASRGKVAPRKKIYPLIHFHSHLKILVTLGRFDPQLPQKKEIFSSHTHTRGLIRSSLLSEESSFFYCFHFFVVLASEGTRWFRGLGLLTGDETQVRPNIWSKDHHWIHPLLARCHSYVHRGFHCPQGDAPSAHDVSNTLTHPIMSLLSAELSGCDQWVYP